MSAAQRDAAARHPAHAVRHLALRRRQRDQIIAAAAALEQHADHDEDPFELLLVAAVLRSVAADWDAANAPEEVGTGPQRLREALCRIADSESGIWGCIAREALDDGRTPPIAAANRAANAPRLAGDAATAARARGQRARTHE
jgi:hypothetical protein